MAKDVKSMLEKLREKMDSVKTDFDSDFLRLETGTTVLRILPPVGEMSVAFQEVGKHYDLPDKTTEFCASYTTGGAEECPICDLISELYRSRNPEDKELAKRIKLAKNFWMNVVVRDPKDRDGIEASGPYIWTPGIQVFQKLKAILNDPDYGDFSEPGEKGFDITVEKIEEKGQSYPKYDVLPRRHSSVLHPDDEVVSKWLEEAFDLSYVILPEDPEEGEDEEVSAGFKIVLLPYGRMVDKYGLGKGKVPEKLYEALEENEEEGSKSKPSSRTAVKETDDEVGDKIRQSRLAHRR